jgi:hypothetical protein
MLRYSVTNICTTRNKHGINCKTLRDNTVAFYVKRKRAVICTWFICLCTLSAHFVQLIKNEPNLLNSFKRVYIYNFCHLEDSLKLKFRRFLYQKNTSNSSTYIWNLNPYFCNVLISSFVKTWNNVLKYVFSDIYLYASWNDSTNFRFILSLMKIGWDISSCVCAWEEKKINENDDSGNNHGKKTIHFKVIVCFIQ